FQERSREEREEENMRGRYGVGFAFNLAMDGFFSNGPAAFFCVRETHLATSENKKNELRGRVVELPLQLLTLTSGAMISRNKGIFSLEFLVPVLGLLFATVSV